MWKKLHQLEERLQVIQQKFDNKCSELDKRLAVYESRQEFNYQLALLTSAHPNPFKPREISRDAS